MPARTVIECKPRKRSDGRWIAQPTIKITDGRSKRITIINRDRGAVVAKLHEIQVQQRKMIPFSTTDWTVGGYLDHWLNNIMPHKVRSSTLISYEGIIRIYIKPSLGRVKLNELGVRDVTQALDKLEQKGIPARTRQKYKQVLSSCLSHAMREELVFRNVAMIAKMPSYHAKLITPWNVEQAYYFLNQIQDDKYYAAHLMLLIYGMRAGETMGMRWTDVDFDNDIIIINQQIASIKGKLFAQEVKTAAGRRSLPLVQVVKQALLELAAASGAEIGKFSPDRELSIENLVFTTVLGTPIDPGNFRKHRSEERRVGKECRSRWSPYH